jgi:hypothetical protein
MKFVAYFKTRFWPYGLRKIMKILRQYCPGFKPGPPEHKSDVTVTLIRSLFRIIFLSQSSISSHFPKYFTSKISSLFVSLIRVT